MFIVLALSFLLLFCCCAQREEQAVAAWCRAALYWCALMFLQTELLSTLHMLTRYAVLTFWVFVSIGAVGWIYCKGRAFVIHKYWELCYRKARWNPFLTAFGIIMVLLAHLLSLPYPMPSFPHHSL